MNNYKIKVKVNQKVVMITIKIMIEKIVVEKIIKEKMIAEKVIFVFYIF